MARVLYPDGITPARGPYGGELYTTGAADTHLVVSGTAHFACSSNDEEQILVGSLGIPSCSCTLNFPNHFFKCGVEMSMGGDIPIVIEGTTVYGLAVFHLTAHTGLEAFRGLGDPPDPRAIPGPAYGLPDHVSGISWSGTLTFTIDMMLEEIFEVIRGGTSFSLGHTFYDAPPFQGVADGPYTTKIVAYHRVKPGSTVSVTADFEGESTTDFDTGYGPPTTAPFSLTAAASDVCTYDDAWVYPDNLFDFAGYPGTYPWGSESASSAAPGYGADCGAGYGCSMYAEFNGVSVHVDYSDANGSSSVAGGVSAARYTVVDPITGAITWYGGLGGFVSLKRQAQLTVSAQAMADPYPAGPLNMTFGQAGSGFETNLLSDGGANWNRLITQQYYFFGSGGAPISESTLGRASCTLIGSEMIARGEGLDAMHGDSLRENGRILMRGLSWPAFTLHHVDTQAIPSIISAAGWTASTGATVTSDGTNLIITTPAGGGSVVRAAQSGDSNSVVPEGTGASCQSWEAWRYIRIVVKSHTAANQPLRVVVTGVYRSSFDGQTWPPGLPPLLDKYWNVTTGEIDTEKTITIDLRVPDGIRDAGTDIDLPELDYKDCYFPIEEGDGAYSGCTFVASYSLENLAASETYTVTGLDFITQAGLLIEAVPANLGPILQDYEFGLPPAEQGVNLYASGDPGTENPIVYRGLLVRVDDKQGLEIPHKYAYLFVDGFGDAFLLYIDYTLTELAAAVNARPGWTATVDALLQPGDGYHGNTLPAGYAGEGGVLIDDPVALDTDYALNARALWDEISWNPLMSGALGLLSSGGGGGLDPPAPDSILAVDAIKILRGRGSGLLIDSTSNAVVSGYTVAASQGGADAGHGTSGVRGAYLTSGNGGPGMDTNTMLSVEGASGTRIWFPRKTSQLTLRPSGGLLPTGAPWNCEHPTGLMRSAVFSGGALRWWHTWAGLPPWKDLMRVPVATADLAVRSRMAVRADRGVIHLIELAAPTGGVHEIDSNNDGRTWGPASLLFAGAAYPGVAVGETGTELRWAIVGGAVVSTLRLPGGVMSGSLGWIDGATGDPLAVSNDTFQATESRRPGRPWLAHLQIIGDTNTSLWRCMSEARAIDAGHLVWRKLTCPGIAGTHPQIAEDRAGDLILAAYSAGAIDALSQPIGSTSWSVYAFGGISVKNDSFGLSAAYEGSRRLALSCVITGESAPSEWWSANGGLNWTRSVQ